MITDVRPSNLVLAYADAIKNHHSFYFFFRQFNDTFSKYLPGDG